jgi:hypothetical protein
MRVRRERQDKRRAIRVVEAEARHAPDDCRHDHRDSRCAAELTAVWRIEDPLTRLAVVVGERDGGRSQRRRRYRGTTVSRRASSPPSGALADACSRIASTPGPASLDQRERFRSPVRRVEVSPRRRLSRRENAIRRAGSVQPRLSPVVGSMAVATRLIESTGSRKPGVGGSRPGGRVAWLIHSANAGDSMCRRRDGGRADLGQRQSIGIPRDRQTAWAFNQASCWAARCGRLAGRDRGGLVPNDVRRRGAMAGSGGVGSGRWRG